MTKIAIIDIDDTICDLVPYLVQVCNKLTGRQLTIADWHSYGVYEMYGISQDTYLQMCEQDQILSKAEPTLLAKETIDRLIKRGYKIILLTARGWHTDAYTLTVDWLMKHNFNYDELHVVPLDKCKSDYIKENIAEKVDLIIDDSPTHIKAFVEDNIARAICLIDQPWNKNHKDLDKYRIEHIVRVLRL